jgi:hypothetical protein
MLSPKFDSTSESPSGVGGKYWLEAKPNRRTEVHTKGGAKSIIILNEIVTWKRQCKVRNECELF